MKILIDQIEWHDAFIVELSFSNTNSPFDCFAIKLESHAFLRDYGKIQLSIIIRDCYKIRTDLNLWIEGRDSISSALIYPSSQWIEEEQKQFVNGFGPKQLFHFEITTNSNSKIEALLTKDNTVDLLI